MALKWTFGDGTSIFQVLSDEIPLQQPRFRERFGFTADG